MPDRHSSASPSSDNALNDRRSPVLAIVPMPPDSNPHGNVFGGWLMSQIDIAGAVVAVQRAHGRVSTIAANNITFLAPVRIGERVLFFADIAQVGNTSITVHVEVFSEKTTAAPSGARIKVSDATMTYVALDGAGQPRPIDEEPMTIRA